jgi:hypothetical protein
MIIYTIEIQDGEREYTEWNYITADIQDYNDDTITDRDLLYEFFGTELEDGDRVVQDGTQAEEYWIGDVIACIGKVNSITERTFRIIREYV